LCLVFTTKVGQARLSAIHVLLIEMAEGVDARPKAGHDKARHCLIHIIANSVFFRSVTSMLPG